MKIISKMKKRHFALVLTLAVFCVAVIVATNTVQVKAVSQMGFESRMHGLEKYSKENPRMYARFSELCMEEIREGAWSTAQTAAVVEAGYLQEYKDELIRTGHYVPTNTSDASAATAPQATATDSRYSAVFNANYYMNKYPDLKANLGNDATALLNHFLTIGMAEGRQGSEEFNLAIYKEKNPDLVAVFGDNNASYYTHYVTSGKAEQRVAR